jgi:uncharacterized membrane protein
VSSTQAYLSAAASGMMALTAIVFAIAFVIVQFSAVAYSPRVVLRFVRDRVLFHTLGIFVATFIYCLWTLAWIDRSSSGKVPAFSVMLVAALVIISMVLFSYLVQRLNDLQITNVLHSIGDSGREVILKMFPRIEGGSDIRKPARPEPVEGTGYGPSTQSLNYSGPPRTVAMIDIDALVRLARAADGVVVMSCAVGDTLVEGTPLLQVYRAKSSLPDRKLHVAIHLDRERTFEQDPKYPIRLLVDIAIKALSPAINDPTTAVQTIDQIEDLLHRLGQSKLDVGCARDTDGTIRLIFPVPTWEDYLALAFDEIRQYGSSSVQVMRRLRSALTSIAGSLTRQSRVHAVSRYIEHLDLAIERSPLDEEDRVQARQEDRQGIGLSRHSPEGGSVKGKGVKAN